MHSPSASSARSARVARLVVRVRAIERVLSPTDRRCAAVAAVVTHPQARAPAHRQSATAVVRSGYSSVLQSENSLPTLVPVSSSCSSPSVCRRGRLGDGRYCGSAPLVHSVDRTGGRDPSDTLATERLPVHRTPAGRAHSAQLSCDAHAGPLGLLSTHQYV